MKDLKILIVDDNLNFINSALRLIDSKLNYELLTWANSGEEALKKVEIFKPTMVIVDVSMKGMNGFDIAEIIRNKKSDIILFIISMEDNSEYKARAERVGANEFLSKVEFATDFVAKAANYYGEDIVKEIVEED